MEDDARMAVIENKMTLGSPRKIDKTDTSLWLGATGALCHMTNSSEGIVERL